MHRLSHVSLFDCASVEFDRPQSSIWKVIWKLNHRKALIHSDRTCRHWNRSTSVALDLAFDHYIKMNESFVTRTMSILVELTCYSNRVIDGSHEGIGPKNVEFLDDCWKHRDEQWWMNWRILVRCTWYSHDDSSSVVSSILIFFSHCVWKASVNSLSLHRTDVLCSDRASRRKRHHN